MPRLQDCGETPESAEHHQRGKAAATKRPGLPIV